MPLYEYRCENCGDQFEVIQKFADQPLTTHEKCGGKVHRLLSAPALQFKGSGWYVNDYAKGANPGGNAPAKKAETPSSSSSNSSSTDSAPAAAPAATSAEKPSS